MIRKIALTVAAAALTMGGVVAFAGPAGAGAKVPLGDAHGTLNCSGITAKVKFNPPLANNNTVPSETTIKSKISGPCSGSLNGAPGAAVTKAKGTGFIHGNSPGTCSGLTQDGTAPVVLHTIWKASGATMNPSDTTFDGVGSEGVGFKLPKTGGSVTASSGSYNGQSVEIHAQADLPDLTKCNPGPNGKTKGIKKLTIHSGTIAIS
jgi:hypothetical protein